ncbi:hypothetical protein [Halomonas sp.]|uniref:hypothetical protein n=1 Tax=Halomonas sp. TaxID=1486246 RepID=UPI003D0D2A43
MTTYTDMQQAYARFRDARDQYDSWLQEHLLSSVKGYEAHLGLEGKRARLNGSVERYVQVGDPFGADGFKSGAFENMARSGAELRIYMRLILEESESSHQKAWAVLKLTCARQGDSVIYMIEPHDMARVEPVSVRIPASLEPPQRTDLYQAMSDVVMQVLDPTPYEE